VVFDASAILAAANHEPGADIVQKHIADSIVSTVNLAEAHGKLVKRGIPANDAWDVALSFCHEGSPSTPGRLGWLARWLRRRPGGAIAG
jgi:hypothetical protein